MKKFFKFQLVNLANRSPERPKRGREINIRINVKEIFAILEIERFQLRIGIIVKHM
jgi:hypothetical protein